MRPASRALRLAVASMSAGVRGAPLRRPRSASVRPMPPPWALAKASMRHQACRKQASGDAPARGLPARPLAAAMSSPRRRVGEPQRPLALQVDADGAGAGQADQRVSLDVRQAELDLAAGECRLACGAGDERLPCGVRVHAALEQEAQRRQRCKPLPAIAWVLEGIGATTILAVSGGERRAPTRQEPAASAQHRRARFPSWRCRALVPKTAATPRRQPRRAVRRGRCDRPAVEPPLPPPSRDWQALSSAMIARRLRTSVAESEVLSPPTAIGTAFVSSQCR